MKLLKYALSLKKKKNQIVWELFGDKNPEVVLVGHSHRTTMALALRKIKNTKKLAVLQESSGPYKIPTLDTGYWDFVLKNKFSNLKKIIIIWQGHLSLIDFLFTTGQQYKLINEKNLKDLQINDNLEIESIIFEKDIISTFEKHFYKDGLAEIIRIYKENNFEIYLLSSPPPKSKIIIQNILHNEEYFKKMHEELIENLENRSTEIISEDRYRVRIWELMQEALSKTAGATGARFIPIPKKFMTKDGTLKEQYCYNDVSHANELYSEELWKYLIEKELI